MPRSSTVCACLIATASIAACGCTDSTRRSDAAYAAAFEVVLEAVLPGQQQDLYCLGRGRSFSVGHPRAKVFDPPPSLIQELTRRGYLVRPISTCKLPTGFSPGRVKELSTGKNAMTISFGDPISAPADSIDISVDYFCGGLCGGLGFVRMSRKSGNWRGRLESIAVS